MHMYNIPTVECKTENRGARGPGGRPAPLLRSRTLPAIVTPGLNILQAQIDARYNAASTGLSAPPAAESGTSAKRGNTASHYYCSKLLTPRISFTDDTIERRVSDSGPPRESSKEHSTRSGRLSTSSIGGSQPLTRLARLLNQRPSFTPSDEIPRRLSWERRDCSTTSSCLPRSSSIDSVAEWSIAGGVGTVSASNTINAGSSYGLFTDQPPPRRSPSPLLGARGDRLSLVSPNIGRRVKGHRAVLGKCHSFGIGPTYFLPNQIEHEIDGSRLDIEKGGIDTPYLINLFQPNNIFQRGSFRNNRVPNMCKIERREVLPAYPNGQAPSRPIVFHALFTSSCLVTRLATSSRLSKEALSPRLFAALGGFSVEIRSFEKNLRSLGVTVTRQPRCLVGDQFLQVKINGYNETRESIDRTSFEFEIALPMVQCVASKSRKIAFVGYVRTIRGQNSIGRFTESDANNKALIELKLVTSIDDTIVFRKHEQPELAIA
ncbi:hypothetical protein K0M31_006638 [Melipona bicolor]|uniref:Uncharacterized protein n=1 Tax=Melipona bicolor TaxID=60889 RepID=A0AA40FRZ2_9HYME|nr:hypothetical protein K0M31_006638 [Melipona bicolor]